MQSADTELRDCYFYHTTDVPGHGVVEGEWDLRGSVDDYLGRVALAGKRVLEVGTASGFLAFEMERRGADVVAYDLSPDDAWDVVPFAAADPTRTGEQRAEHLRRLNNSWHLMHRKLASRVRVVYGSVYAIPPALAPVDVVTFGAILMHLRDPMLALQRGVALDPHTIVVTELARPWTPRALVEGRARRRSPLFLPDAATGGPRDAWWSFTPEAIANMLAIFGYATVWTLRHAPLHRGRRTPMFTVVGERARAAREEV